MLNKINRKKALLSHYRDFGVIITLKYFLCNHKRRNSIISSDNKLTLKQTQEAVEGYEKFSQFGTMTSILL